MTKNRDQKSRPKVPGKTQLKLWVAAGGRCEFPGCNKYLFTDNVTLSESNYSNIAHIVAYSPSGARGDEILSKQLEKDFDNLMLMCKDHAWLIDDRENKDFFTVEMLKGYKHDHETRIYNLTNTADDKKVSILKFIAPINGNKPIISNNQIKEALLPYYPVDKEGQLMDFTNVQSLDNDPTSIIRQINRCVERMIEPGVDKPSIARIAVFAIAPIPLLMILGQSLGNIAEILIYQRHKDTDSWVWPVNGVKPLDFEVQEPIELVGKEEVALVLAVSGIIPDQVIHSSLEHPLPIYRITILNPNRDAVKNRDDILEFKRKLQSTLKMIRENHPSLNHIHIFPALPVSLAVAAGQEFSLKLDSQAKIYDFSKDNSKFIYKLDLFDYEQ